MKRRSKAGLEPIKGRRRKTPELQSLHAPKAGARSNSPPAAGETEVARLRRERDEALEQQTATSEVLQVISSSTGDLRPVFGTILEKAVRYCDADFGTLFLYEKDQTSLVAAHNMPTAFSEAHRTRPGVVPGGPVETAMRTRRTVHIPDLAATQPYGKRDPRAVDAVELGSVRAIVAVPMLKDNEPIGAIAIHRPEVRPFTEKQIALLENFAAQAVIAIENARLLDELRQSLEQQTATSEVLKVISASPGDLKPVFATMLEKAVRICDGKFGNIYRWDGDARHLMASHNTPSAFVEARRYSAHRPGPETPSGRMIATKALVHIVDMAAEHSYTARDPWAVDAVELGGVRTLLVLPMLKENELVGAFSIFRQEVRAFTDKQIELMQNFAAQAVIAIENARLLSDLRQRTDELGRSVEELRALGEVSQAVNSTLDLETVLSTIVGRAVQLSRADAGAIYVFDEEQQEFRLHATHGMSETMIAAITDRRIGLGDASLGPAAIQREPIQVPDLRNEPASPVNEIVLAEGYRSILIVPMLRPDHIVGGLVVRRKIPGEFSKSTIDLLQTFADQSVVAIQNARLFESVEARTREVETANRQLELADRYKSHFLASASHDLRQPLHALNLFVAQMQTETKPAERTRLLSRIDAAVASMNELFEALLDMTKLDAGILQANPAEFAVQRLLDRIETTFAELADKKGLSLRVVPCGAWVRSDPILLERILFNLVGNAVRYTARGGVVVGCRHRATQLRIDVFDTGAGIPEDQRQNIFSEFYQLANPAPDRKAGLGLGLAIVDRLSRLLGHSVQLESHPGRGSRFSVSVPLAAELRDTVPLPIALHAADLARGKRVMVIDDDVLVLDGMRGILQSWGCRVQTAESGTAALASVADGSALPDLIISDLRLANGESGIEVIGRLREALGAPIPAFVISGDTAPERLREASAGGYYLLQKPVSPMTLRTTLNRLLKSYDARAPFPHASVG